MGKKEFDYSGIEPQDVEELKRIATAIQQLQQIVPCTGAEAVAIGRQLFRAKCILAKYEPSSVALIEGAI